MPYSTEHFKDAISRGDLGQVQLILADRNPQGIPRVDVNNGFGNLGTALLWALIAKPVNALIIQTLLDLRDVGGNPIININHQGPHGRTAVSWLFEEAIAPDLRRQLLQSIIDMRGPTGALIVNLNVDRANVSLFKFAQSSSDIACLRILADASV